MSEKHAVGDTGKDGATSKSSLRSLLPQSSSKEAAPSSPNLSRLFNITRSRSTTSNSATCIDSDSYVHVVVNKDQSTGSLQDSNGAKGGGVKADEANATSEVINGGDRSPAESEVVKEKEKRKKMRGTMFPFDQISPAVSSHRQKNVELHRIFNSIDSSEKLIDDYSCALQRDILIHGRLFVTQNWLCFYANIFTWETLLTIPFVGVTAITKERTAYVFPNAVQITTSSEKYGFSSLISRDITYNVLFKVWQNSLLNEHLTPLELVKAARRVSGDSSDVGTADNLWGEGSSATEKPKMPKVTASLPAVLPTHVEIMTCLNEAETAASATPQLATTSPSVDDTRGSNASSGTDVVDTEGNSTTVTTTATTPATVITTASTPSSTGTIRELNLSGMTRERAVNQDCANDESQAGSAPSENREDQIAVTPVTPGGGDFPERMSMGGESLGSFSEFETLSFADDPGEIPCGCSEHIGRIMINEVYEAHVETIFQLLFTDPDFRRDFLKARNTINIDISEWQEQTDGSKLRDLNYTVALNYSFGPKFSPTTEHQVYSNTAQPGLKHLVHTEVMNRNIPYADTFFVSCQYCMTRVAHNKTRLRVTANINFRKSCWGVVKNLIEKNAGDGVRSFYNHLDNFLKEHLASLPPHFRTHRRKRRRHTSRARHRKTPQLPIQSPTSVDVEVPNREELPTPSLPASPLSIQHQGHPSTTSLQSFPINGTTPTETDVFTLGAEGPVPSSGRQDKRRQDKRSSNSFPQVNMALTLLLGILIVSNMALYHHLMSYQSPPTTTSSTSLPVDPLTDHLEWPTTNQEWITLTRRHLESHETQRQQWLDTIATLVTTLEQAESSLSLAKQVLSEATNKHSLPSFPTSSSHSVGETCSQSVDENRIEL